MWNIHWQKILVRGGLWGVAGLALLFWSAGAAVSALHRGSPAPDFKLSDLNGKTVSLSDFRGKVVVVTFWATYCVGCKAELPYLKRYYRKYENKKAVLLGLSVDRCPVRKIKEFVKRWNISYPILRADRKTIRRWRVRALPTTYLIDPEGRIQECYIGPEATGLLDRHTQRLLSR